MGEKQSNPTFCILTTDDQEDEETFVSTKGWHLGYIQLKVWKVHTSFVSCFVNTGCKKILLVLLMLYNFLLNTFFKTVVLQWNLEVIGFCMVKFLLKLTQPFIHNEPFTYFTCHFLKPAQVCHKWPTISSLSKNLLSQKLPVFFGSLF